MRMMRMMREIKRLLCALGLAVTIAVGSGVIFPEPVFAQPPPPPPCPWHCIHIGGGWYLCFELC